MEPTYFLNIILANNTIQYESNKIFWFFKVVTETMVFEITDFLVDSPWSIFGLHAYLFLYAF